MFKNAVNRWLLQALLLGACTFMTGFGVYRTLFGQNVRWATQGGPEIRYLIVQDSFDRFDADGVDRGGTRARRIQAVRDAAQTWNDISTSNVNYVLQGLISESDFHAHFWGDYVFDCAQPLRGYFNNPVYVAEESFQHASTNDAAAMTYSYYCHRTSFRGFDLEIRRDAKSGTIQWSSDPNISMKTDRMDLRGVVTHEFGHGLGLVHDIEELSGFFDGYKFGSEPPCDIKFVNGLPVEIGSGLATMCGKGIAGGSYLGRTLASDDIRGIEVLYPAKTPTRIFMTVHDGRADGPIGRDWEGTHVSPVEFNATQPVCVQFNFEYIDEDDNFFRVQQARSPYTTLLQYGWDADMNVHMDDDDWDADNAHYMLLINGNLVVYDDLEPVDNLDQVIMRATEVSLANCGI